VSTRLGWPVLGVLVLGFATATLIGNCGGSPSSPSPVARATPTRTPHTGDADSRRAPAHTEPRLAQSHSHPDDPT
jgi:hypothetical protein